MKKILFRIFAMSLALIMLLGGLSSFAAAYTTFTYSINGDPLYSPDAYRPEIVIDSRYMELETPLNEPSDLFADSNGKLYIADPKNNRIVVLNKYYKLDFIITDFINDNGVPDSLNGAMGVYVKTFPRSGESLIYVADTNNARIVVFDYEGNFQRIVPQPADEVFEEGSIYRPSALAVDDSGRMYVVSTTTYEGIISLAPDGSFTAFIGAQKVTYSVLELIFRWLQSDAQKRKRTLNISTEYNNITIDSKGMIYVTTQNINENEMLAAIQSRSKSGDKAPVKKLNTSGDDIMRRNGFYPPSGEVPARGFRRSFSSNAPTGASTIVDVALGPEGTWSIIDQKRSRIFTYDEDGKLLFAFGDLGEQLGNLKLASSITYHGDDLLALDQNTNSFTVFKRTEYGDKLIQAIKNNNEKKYHKATEDWYGILRSNNNFDAAYVGIGKAQYRTGNWKEAMETFKIAYDTSNYSTAFKALRKEVMTQYFLVIVLGVVVLGFAIYLFFSYAAKVNKRTALIRGRKTFWQEVIYGFHVIFHPFDGFWDLKHEKRGSIRGAFFWLGMLVLAFSYRAIGKAYLFNPNGSYLSIFSQLAMILVPIILLVTSNWCLTTLFEGEGSFKDIFIAVSYSTIPLTLLIVPETLLTHVVSESEVKFISLIFGIATVWVGLLAFFGIMVTHDFTLGKNIGTVLATIVGMMVIMFVVLLFGQLIAKMITFVNNLYVEASFNRLN